MRRGEFWRGGGASKGGSGFEFWVGRWALGVGRSDSPSGLALLSPALSSLGGRRGSYKSGCALAYFLLRVRRTETWRAWGMTNFFTSTVTRCGANSSSTIVAISAARVSMSSQWQPFPK